jgi:hypothetical protein
MGVDDLPRRLRRTARLHRGALELQTPAPTRALRDLCSWAVEKGIELDALTVGGPSLEQVYLRLTGEDADGREFGGEDAEGRDFTGEDAEGPEFGREDPGAREPAGEDADDRG